MKLCALFSGGKDSTFAIFKAGKDGHLISCLLNVRTNNTDSFMFHSINQELTTVQAEKMKVPLELLYINGDKEVEVEELKHKLAELKDKYAFEGVVTGAIASNYQKSRINRICEELGLKCVNPLWGIDGVSYLRELIANNFKVLIISVSADGLDKNFLGRNIDESLIKVFEKLLIHPTGEGGEYESFVVDCPIFSGSVNVKPISLDWFGDSGYLKLSVAD